MGPLFFLLYINDFQGTFSKPIMHNFMILFPSFEKNFRTIESALNHELKLFI